MGKHTKLSSILLKNYYQFYPNRLVFNQYRLFLDVGEKRLVRKLRRLSRSRSMRAAFLAMML
jgi:hypothetical protein